MRATIPNGSYQNEELHQLAISSYEAETQSNQNNAHREEKNDNISKP